MPFRKPEPIPLIFMICAITFLLGLGFWQLERLQWKSRQLEAITAAQVLPALGSLPQELNGLDYRHVVLVGTFLHDKTLHQVGHPQGEGPGFYLLTPFELEDDGRIILVNRGFSPLNAETKPEGSQTVKGIIRPARMKRLFSPSNNAEKNVWFYEDFDAMAQTTGLTLTPVIVEAVGEAEKGVYPIPHDGTIALRNDHLNYAITWFCLAVIGAVMFAFYQRKPD